MTDVKKLKVVQATNAQGEKIAVLMLEDGTRVVNMVLNDDGTIKSAETAAFLRTILLMTETA